MGNTGSSAKESAIKMKQLEELQAKLRQDRESLQAHEDIAVQQAKLSKKAWDDNKPCKTVTSSLPYKVVADTPVKSNRLSVVQLVLKGARQKCMERDARLAEQFKEDMSFAQEVRREKLKVEKDLAIVEKVIKEEGK